MEKGGGRPPPDVAMPVEVETVAASDPQFSDGV